MKFQFQSIKRQGKLYVYSLSHHPPETDSLVFIVGLKSQKNGKKRKEKNRGTTKLNIGKHKESVEIRKKIGYKNNDIPQLLYTAERNH